MTIVLLFLGLCLLIYGAELLVKGASRLAAAAGISRLAIGLTVVAFGTSAPEMAVSAFSSYQGQPDIAIGNAVGSNIFNVLFVLGLSALIAPLSVSRRLVRFDVPLMIAVSLLLVALSFDRMLSRTEGVLLFASIVGYTTFLLFESKKELAANEAAAAGEQRGSAATNLLLLAVGLGALVLGSRWLVAGAVQIARYFEVSELTIGLTVVAAGTSLPEVATSAVAAFRGERDIAVGNVIGSNVFNILAVLGLAAMVAPQGVPVSEHALLFDIPVMVVVAAACLPVFFTGYTVARWEGALFLVYYFVYAAYLVFSATGAELLPQFRAALVWYCVPLTALVLLADSARSFIGARAQQG